MITRMTKPIDDGFYMPAEFSEHYGTILLWPLRNDIWRDNAIYAQKTIANLVAVIMQHEKVIVGVMPEQYENAKKMLPQNIVLIKVAYNDIWVRDTGPTFVLNNGVIRGIDWDFNAWGGIAEGSYYPWDLDDMLAENILKWFSVDRYKESMVLEGGAFHVDGEGTLIAIKSCVLNKNRNPNLNCESIENKLKNNLGIKKIIWLENGLPLEENNGHVDNICAFIEPGHIFLAWSDDEKDEQYKISREAYKVLINQKDACGRNIKITKIPMPAAMYISEAESEGIRKHEFALPRLAGDRMPASYINFYFINSAIIIPKLNCSQDEVVYNIFKNAMPNRTIYQIPAREFLIGGGGIHCVTMQIPQSAISLHSFE